MHRVCLPSIVNERIRFPVGWRIYQRNGISKWKLALEIIDEVKDYGLNISVVLFDSWFCVQGFIKQLERRKLSFIGDVKTTNGVEFNMMDDPDIKISISLGQLFKCGKPILKEVWLGLKSMKANVLQRYSIKRFQPLFI